MAEFTVNFFGVAVEVVEVLDHQLGMHAQRDTQMGSSGTSAKGRHWRYFSLAVLAVAATAASAAFDDGSGRGGRW